jgi:hypothetical protein
MNSITLTTTAPATAKWFANNFQAIGVFGHHNEWEPYDINLPVAADGKDKAFHTQFYPNLLSRVLLVHFTPDAAGQTTHTIQIANGWANRVVYERVLDTTNPTYTHRNEQPPTTFGADSRWCLWLSHPNGEGNPSALNFPKATADLFALPTP